MLSSMYLCTHFVSVAPHTQFCWHRKSLELRRLLDLKLKADISATNRTVLCLDIAATLLGSVFDTEEALKRIKCRPNDYLRQRRTVEKLLGTAKQITIAELCVQLDLVRNVQQLAARLFDAYRERAQIDDQSDFTHPQYAAMSVYQACKAQRVRVSRSTLLRHSHLRGAQWTLLEKDWIKCMGPADEVLAELQRIEQRTAAATAGEKRTGAADALDATTATDDDAAERKAKAARREDGGAGMTESYEVWSERMLKVAYAQLAAEEGEATF